jgi:hypothetical protein
MMIFPNTLLYFYLFFFLQYRVEVLIPKSNRGGVQKKEEGECGVRVSDL